MVQKSDDHHLGCFKPGQHGINYQTSTGDRQISGPSTVVSFWGPAHLLVLGRLILSVSLPTATGPGMFKQMGIDPSMMTSMMGILPPRKVWSGRSTGSGFKMKENI